MVRKVVKDNINPSYYKKKIQVTDFIIEYEMNFLEGNIIKYVCRHKAKNGLEDLKKAKWYLEKLIECTKK
jgi:hypothetical protein|tara:strand:- start:27470 stop:27679 length:210 start_codon:yes stop_codon:yes gene_type:complete